MVTPLREYLGLVQVFFVPLILIVSVGLLVEQEVGLVGIIAGVTLLIAALSFSWALDRFIKSTHKDSIKIALRASGLVILGVAAGYAISVYQLSWELVFILVVLAFYYLRFLENTTFGMRPTQRSRQ